MPVKSTSFENEICFLFNDNFLKLEDVVTNVPKEYYSEMVPSSFLNKV